MLILGDDYSKNTFKVDEPAIKRVPFIFNSPHSGRHYSPEFLELTRLNHQAIRKSEDFMVDELFESAIQSGASFLRANFPRAWLDVNREPYELDPSMFHDKLPSFANSNSVRVNNGLGTIAKIVADNEEIYRERLAVTEALRRIDTLYKPYHEVLRKLLAQAVIQFGHAVLIDCHSMPSQSERRGKSRSKADFVLGNRYGTSCTPELTHSAYEILTAFGYQVEINKPYAGGFITEHYGRPENGLHALQIEVNRSLYMDELRLEKSTGFSSLASDIASFSAQLINMPEVYFKGTTPLAAE